MSADLQPTMHLRIVRASKDKNPRFIRFSQLRQWWQSSDGGGEWRAIPNFEQDDSAAFDRPGARRAATWSDIAGRYDSCHSHKAHTLPMELVFLWAKNQKQLFEVDDEVLYVVEGAT